MKELAVYIHGKGGCAGESEHIKPLFPECEVVGLDYQTFTPWETGKEIREAVIKLKTKLMGCPDQAPVWQPGSSDIL